MTTPDPDAEPTGQARRLSPPRLATGLVITAVAGLVGLLAWGLFKPSPGSGLVAKIAQGQTPAAPPFDLEAVWPENRAWPRELEAALADGRLTLGELRGHPVVLNMWASWCIPCRREAPILNTSARTHAGEVTFVGIDVRDLRSDARDFLQEFHVPYVSLRDRDDTIFTKFGLTGVPETYYLDQAGRIIAHTPGPITHRTLEAGIREAMNGVPAQ